eukprot:gnl/TRDRNA2_/TRDRNA2_165538_c0_seq1.p1 gnl/TRDRNA2_/TRDRNA2_165538_c0~~gnl/TRDRNA2_/TRDRNA2_165538_c0_seq1.p1  ORF type:complete len:624 (+),score=205.46 gnl/TRDRNA2_/TRDRNA2_165538_c0_seq1:61-1872(+)
MVDHATAKYLSDNIGGTLSKALAEMAISQPVDGVDFLAQWLKTYAEQEEAKAYREREEKVLEEERAKTKAIADEKAAKVEQKIAAAKAVEDGYEGLLKKFNEPSILFEDSMWLELVSTVKRYMNASAVYLGTYDEEGLDNGATGPCIRYDYATPGHEWMTEKVLPKDTGVTHGSLIEKPPEETFPELYIWKPPPPPAKEPPPVAEGEEPPPPEEVPTPSYYPVYIDCVTDVDKVHYFDMARLGSYLSVPLVFPSYHTAEALAEAKKFEVEKNAEAATRAQAIADAEAAAQGEEEKDPESPEAIAAREEANKLAEPVPEKELVLPGQSTKMVLCLDTLGTNTNFTAFGTSKIEKLIELCKACGESKARTEMKEVDEQALATIDEEAIKSMEEDCERITKDVGDVFEEPFNNEKAAIAEQGLEEEPKAAAEALLEKRYAFLKARQAVVELKASIMKLKSWVVVTPEVMNVLAGITLILGYKKEKIYPKRKSTLKWELLKTLLETSLFDAIAKVEVNDVRKDLAPEQKLSYIKANCLPADMDEAKAKEVSPIFEAMFVFLREACAYRAADLENRKVQYDKRKAAAEEAGEAWTEPPLAEADDDLAE